MQPTPLTTFENFCYLELRKYLNDETKHKANNRILHSNRLEHMIYADLRKQVEIGLDEIEAAGVEKLDTFPALIQDVFQSFYSLNSRRNDADTLTTNARQFNAEILDYMMNSSEYSALKSLCEGQELPAYEAVKEFSRCISEKLDELLDADALDELSTLDQQQAGLNVKIKEALERGNATDEANILSMVESIADKNQRIVHLSKKINRDLRRNRHIIQSAVASAKGKAQEASYAISAWGTCDSSPKAIQQNVELLNRLQSSQKLRDIIKYLGKYREILGSTRKSSYIYGRGDKYDIVLGSDFTRAVSSEYAYLALPETIPLFIQKVQRKTLKQYRKRECVTKGHGDIVVCIDESGSMDGDPIAWAKAVALVLLEHATQNNRSCAMVRFASSPETVTHLFTKGKYTPNDVFDFAESFLGGGTNFEIPLNKAVTLIEAEGFENADIIFISDGQCCISEGFAKDFCDKSKQLKFSVTGIVIDPDEAIADFSLAPFCKNIYRLGKMTGDNIALNIITSFVQ